MSKTGKKVFLILSIAVPFFIYCVYYYSHMINNAPYKFSEFESMTIQFGRRDSMLNKYDSKTGDYQYLNNRDSVVKMHLHLKNDELLFLHRKASELGFWDFPKNEVGDTTDKKVNPVRYIIAFNYKRKSKRVLFDSNFVGDPRLIDANEQVIKQIQEVLSDEEAKQKK